MRLYNSLHRSIDLAFHQPMGSFSLWEGLKYSTVPFILGVVWMGIGVGIMLVTSEIGGYGPSNPAPEWAVVFLNLWPLPFLLMTGVAMLLAGKAGVGHLRQSKSTALED